MFYMPGETNLQKIRLNNLEACKVKLVDIESQLLSLRGIRLEGDSLTKHAELTSEKSRLESQMARINALIQTELQEQRAQLISPAPVETNDKAHKYAPGGEDRNIAQLETYMRNIRLSMLNLTGKKLFNAQAHLMDLLAEFNSLKGEEVFPKLEVPEKIQEQQNLFCEIYSEGLELDASKKLKLAQFESTLVKLADKYVISILIAYIFRINVSKYKIRIDELFESSKESFFSKKVYKMKFIVEVFLAFLNRNTTGAYKYRVLEFAQELNDYIAFKNR